MKIPLYTVGWAALFVKGTISVSVRRDPIATAIGLAYDAEPLDAMTQAREARRLELLQSLRNDAAEPAPIRLQRRVRAQCQFMHQQVAPAKDRRLLDHLVEAQTDRGVVRGDDGAGAHPHHHLHRNLMADDASQHTQMRRAAETSGAQDDANAHGFRIETHRAV